MKKIIFTLLVLQVTLSLHASGQTKRGLTLSLLIPDTAFTLNAVEDFRSEYEKNVKTNLERGVKKKNIPSILDSISGEAINSMTYYKLIAYKSADYLQFLMEVDFPRLKINLIQSPQGIQNPTEFKEMTEKSGSDFIVMFNEIKAGMDESEVPTLILKVEVYSRKRAKVVFQKEVAGGIANEGGRSACSGMFDCMVNNSVNAASVVLSDYLFLIRNQ